LANSKSAAKRDRQSLKRRQRNNEVKAALKTIKKKLTASIENKQPDEARATLSRFYKAVDKATAKGIIKKNTGARNKANLAQKVSQLQKNDQN